MITKTITEKGFCAWHPETEQMGSACDHETSDLFLDLYDREQLEYPELEFNATDEELIAHAKAEGWRIVPVTICYEVEK